MNYISAVESLIRVNQDYHLVSFQYDDFVAERIAKLRDGMDVQLYLFTGANSEIGELFDLLAKGMQEGREVDPDMFLEECGDVLFNLCHKKIESQLIGDSLNTLLEVLQVMGINHPDAPPITIRDLEEININKLNKRQADTGSHLK